jgi:hypothetical protein
MAQPLSTASGSRIALDTAGGHHNQAGSERHGDAFRSGGKRERGLTACQGGDLGR